MKKFNYSFYNEKSKVMTRRDRHIFFKWLVLGHDSPLQTVIRATDDIFDDYGFMEAYTALKDILTENTIAVKKLHVVIDKASYTAQRFGNLNSTKIKLFMSIQKAADCFIAISESLFTESEYTPLWLAPRCAVESYELLVQHAEFPRLAKEKAGRNALILISEKLNSILIFRGKRG